MSGVGGAAAPPQWTTSNVEIPMAEQSELSITEQLKAANQQLGQLLIDQEKQRKALVNDLLKLAWKIGVPEDDKAVLEAADLTLTGLVQTVGRWVDGAIKRANDKKNDAAWETAWAKTFMPDLLTAVEAMLANDGAEGSRYDAIKLSDARAEVVALVKQLRDVGVGVEAEAKVEDGAAGNGGGA